MKNSVLDIWNPLKILWAPGLGNSSLALPAIAYAACLLKLRMTLLHSCCCSFHGTDISKMLSSLLQLCHTFSKKFSWALCRDVNPARWCQAWISLHVHFIPGVSTSTEPSHSQCQLLATLYDSFQYHTGNSYQVQLPAWETALVPSGTHLLYTDSEETLLRRFCFNNSGLFLITADFSAPDDHYQLFQQSKDFTLVVLVSC